MKKFIHLLAICLVILCLFSSCGEMLNHSIQGTWEYEFREGATNYVSYKVVVSEDKIQISKNTYGLSRHRLPKSSDVSELMPYTVGENGVLTLNYSVGVMKEIDITDTFTLDETQNKLMWAKGYSEWVYSMNKVSSESNFSEPTRGYERYTCEHVIYDEPGEEKESFNSSLFLYQDGSYMWDGISLGHWEKSGNKISLFNSSGWAFSRMDLNYVVDSPEASHLEEETIEGTFGEGFTIFTGFSYDYYKFVDYFNVD